MTRLLFILAVVLGILTGACAAQTTIPICSEVCTVTASSTAAVFEFGAGTKLNTVTGAAYPLLVNCGNAAACKLLGGDPAPQVVKTLYAVEQAASYTVTWVSAAGVKIVATVPAVVQPPLVVTTKHCTYPAGSFDATVPGDGSFTAPIAVVVTCK